MEYVVELRRFFHKYPELSGKEENTSSKIKEELSRLKISYESVGEYGVIGILKGENRGKTIALRADIDALPIREDNKNLMKDKTVVSSIQGVCHACGHDAHIAMLLSSAHKLSEMREEISGTILFCFESGEEDGSGVGDMLEALEKRRVDAVWGMHVYSSLPSGKMSVEEGPRMSGAYFFNVEIIGKGGHGSTPHQTIDPINCTVDILSNLNSIITREIDPAETSVLTIGKLSAGSAANIIPNSSTFSGTIRYFKKEVGREILGSLYRIVEGIADVHRCKTSIEITTPGFPVVNDKTLSTLAEESVKRSIGKDNLVKTSPWMASESMGYYLDKYPGVFAFLGIKEDEVGSGANHHNPLFDIDETSLSNGVKATVQFALDFLDVKGK